MWNAIQIKWTIEQNDRNIDFCCLYSHQSSFSRIRLSVTPAEAKATTKLSVQRFVWPSIRADCHAAVRSRVHSVPMFKVSPHVKWPVGTFTEPSSPAGFEHVHVDIIKMPISEGNRYCFTCLDRFTRWPIPNMQQSLKLSLRRMDNGYVDLAHPYESQQIKENSSSHNCSRNSTDWQDQVVSALQFIIHPPMAWLECSH